MLVSHKKLVINYETARVKIGGKTCVIIPDNIVVANFRWLQ